MRPSETRGVLTDTARTATLCALQARTMACGAPTTIDRLHLLLAVNFCDGAARQLREAAKILADQEEATQ